jgi:transcriptional regulator with XRE-family HTH domain
MISDDDLAAAYAEVGRDAEPGVFARAIRRKLGLSLQEVASRVGGGTHFTTISKLEKGTMHLTYDWARALAAVYGISASVLHMPYEAMNTVKRIPVYVSIHDAVHREAAAADRYAGFLTSSESLFGFTVFGFADVVSDWAMYTAVVDPHRRDLSDGSIYLFQIGGSDEGLVGIYRTGSLYPAIVPWPRTGDMVIITEEVHALVLGEVIELQRTLASRNR